MFLIICDVFMIKYYKYTTVRIKYTSIVLLYRKKTNFKHGGNNILSILFRQTFTQKYAKKKKCKCSFNSDKSFNSSQVYDASVYHNEVYTWK